MAKKATSADKAKPATKRATAKSPAATGAPHTAPQVAAQESEPGMGSSPLVAGVVGSPAADPPAQESFLLSPPEQAPLSLPTPPRAGASADEQPAAEATLPPVQSGDCLPVIPVLVDAAGNTFIEGDIQPEDTNQSEPTSSLADGQGLIQSPPPEVQPPVVETAPASEPLQIVHPGNYRTRAGSHSGEFKGRYYTPEPPDLGVR